MTLRKNLWALALPLLLLLIPESVWAVPAFARRYKTSCQTCHETFPRRNAVGEAFRLNGFRFVDDEVYRKSEPVELGDETYEKLWPNSILPNTLPDLPPLSVVTRFLFEQDLDGSRGNPTTLLTPEELELVWAGPMGEDFTLYGDAIFLQSDFAGGEVKSWMTLKAYLQLDDIFGGENLCNLRVGSVGTNSLGVFTALDSNRLSSHPYLYTSWSIPDPYLATATTDDDTPYGEAALVKFTGNAMNLQPRLGVEFNGFGPRWAYALGIVNSNPKTSTNEVPDAPVSFLGAVSNSPDKDYFLQLAWKAGGLPFTGLQPPDDPTKDPLSTLGESWRDDHLILSLFGYYGTATVKSQATFISDVEETKDFFWRLGAGAEWKKGDFSLNGMVMAGDNSHPYGPLTDALSDESVSSLAWHVEGMYFAYPWLIPYAKYQALDLTLPSGIDGINPDQDQGVLLAGVKMMLRPNVGLLLEVPTYFKGEDNWEGIDGTFYALLNVSF